MSKRTGLITAVFQGLKKSLLRSGTKQTCVGTDHLGNKYFEKEADSSRGLKGHRWVEPPNKDEFTVPEIPAEWDAWLKQRRKVAPTQELIDRNQALMMRTLERAKELEEKDRQEMEEEKLADSGSITSRVKDIPLKREFPKYPEYEEFNKEHADRHKKS